MSEEIACQFLNQHPEIERVEFIFPDINGVPRGKWVNRAALIKAFNGGMRMPRSSYVLDIWGDTAEGTGLLMKAGDQDGYCVPLAHTLGEINWMSQPAAQCLFSMDDQDGSAFYADPRQVLKRVLARYSEDGLRPVIALELEFYLLDQKLTATGHPQAPAIPGSQQRYAETQLLSLLESSDFEAVLSAINSACIALGIPAETVIKENSPAQFEINLLHQDDALLSADQAFLLKRLIKGCAQKHGYTATFMAKPFADWAGNGMHIHASVLNGEGENIFQLSGQAPQGEYAHAIAGLLDSTQALLAYYAPHANSYRRLVAGAGLAPTTLSWGYENRTAMVRLPMAEPKATRIEQRLAGADANPYLVAAATLAGMHHGIAGGAELGDETVGNAYDQHPPELAISWREAVERAATSELASHYFGDRFCNCFDKVKCAELKRFDSTITDFEYTSYLRHV